MSQEPQEENTLDKLRKDNKDIYAYVAQLCAQNEKLQSQNAQLSKINEELISEKHDKSYTENITLDMSGSADLSFISQGPVVLHKNFPKQENKIKENQIIAQELQFLAELNEKMTKTLKECNGSNESNEQLQKQFEILIQNKDKELKLIEKLKSNLQFLESQQNQQIDAIRQLTDQSQSQESKQLPVMNQLQNILLIKQYKSQNKNEVMPVKDTFNLFEEFLTAKLKQDQIDFQACSDNEKMHQTANQF